MEVKTKNEKIKRAKNEEKEKASPAEADVSSPAPMCSKDSYWYKKSYEKRILGSLTATIKEKMKRNETYGNAVWTQKKVPGLEISLCNLINTKKKSNRKREVKKRKQKRTNCDTNRVTYICSAKYVRCPSRRMWCLRVSSYLLKSLEFWCTNKQNK